MKRNGAISLIVALAMLLSSLSGLTAITASADGEPTLSDFMLVEKHSMDFKDWTCTDNTFTGTGIENWEYSGNVGWSKNFIQAKKSNGILTYKKFGTNEAFYYKYSIRMTSTTDDADTVSLDGTEDGIVLATKLVDTSEHEFITIVSGNTAYTYNSDGTVAKTTKFTGTPTGLKLTCKSGEILIKSISYGEVITPPELSDFVLTQTDSVNLSSWTADAGVLSGDGVEDWTQTGSFTIADGVQVSGQNNSLTYNKALESGSFYYTYQIRMVAADKYSSVNLAGVTSPDTAVLTSPLETTSSYYTFTTVVNSGVAYTYNDAGVLQKSTVFTGEVTGLTFKNTANREMRIKTVSFGTVKKNANIGIDYENEKLTGFVDGGSYTIDGTPVTPVNNELTIADNYFGQTLEIGGTLDGIGLTQSLEVKARPAAPTAEDITVTQPTEIDGNGTVAGITSEMEYSTDNGEAWTTGDGETKEIDGGTTALVRVKAVADTSFKSLNYEAAIKTRSAVTLNLNNGSFENDEDNVTSYLEGEEVTLPVPKRTGYTFDGWYTKENPEEGDEAATSIPANSTGALVYYVKWTPEKYTITWLDGDGSELDKQENVDYDSIITATSKTPTKASNASENYTFNAWENFTAGTTKVTGNMTFTPAFTSSTRTYTVKWSVDGNETEETLAYGAALTHTAPAKTEHTFDGWYKESTFETKLGENETVTGDITLYAKYTVIKYAINAPDTVTELKINGENADSLPTAAKGAAVTFKVPVAAGKKLAGDVTAAGNTLTADSEGVYSFTMPGEEVTISAVVQDKAKSGVSITPHAGVTIKVNNTDSLADVMEGETVTVTAEVDERYTLTSLKWNGTDIESGGSFTMPAETVMITAETQVKPVAAITVETNPSSVQHGQSAAVTANARLWADEEKTIELTSLYPSAEVDWSLDSASSTAGSTVSGTTLDAAVSVNAAQPTGNMTVTAKIGDKSGNGVITITAEPLHTITVDSGITHGTVTTSPSGQVTKDTEITITVTPDTANGYQLKANSVKVTKTGDAQTEVIVTDNTFTMPDYDVTVTAEFELKQYTVTWYDEDGETVLASAEVDYGVIPVYPNVNAPEKASDGTYNYTFAGWTVEPAAVTGPASYTAKYTATLIEKPKAYLTLLEAFENVIQIEKTTDEDGNVILTASKKDGADIDELPSLTMYMAVYSNENVLISAKKLGFDANTAKVVKSEIDGAENYKLLIWTGKYEPVTVPITAETQGNNKLFE